MTQYSHPTSKECALLWAQGDAAPCHPREIPVVEEAQKLFKCFRAAHHVIKDNPFKSGIRQWGFGMFPNMMSCDLHLMMISASSVLGNVFFATFLPPGSAKMLFLLLVSSVKVRRYPVYNEICYQHILDLEGEHIPPDVQQA